MWESGRWAGDRRSMYQDLGPRSSVIGSWYLVLGSWFFEPAQPVGLHCRISSILAQHIMPNLADFTAFMKAKSQSLTFQSQRLVVSGPQTLDLVPSSIRQITSVWSAWNLSLKVSETSCHPTPPSTLNNVGLVARPQHSPCPCYKLLLVRCWRVGTILVLRTLVDATAHHPIDRWEEQTERWLCRWYYPRILRQWWCQCRQGQHQVRVGSL